MILLEATNQLIIDFLNKRFDPEYNDKEPIIAADFDGTTIEIIPGSAKSPSKISIRIPEDLEVVLKQFNMNDVLKRIYGPFFQEEPDKDVQDKPFTATLSFEHKTVTEEQKQQILQTFPLVRRNLFLGAFEYAFDKAISKEEEKRYFEPIVLPYRKDETIYILPPEKASSLRVCYTLKFQDAEDIVFANKVFLQEFKDSRRNKALNNAPTVAFTQASKPGDLKLVDEKKKITREGDDPESLKEYSFIIIALFNQHMSLESRATNIDKLISYRSYFHYHLKCSKAYLHFRMRSRFAELEKRNSDAQDRHGMKTEKRTASGRYFKEKK